MGLVMLSQIGGKCYYVLNLDDVPQALKRLRNLFRRVAKLEHHW